MVSTAIIEPQSPYSLEEIQRELARRSHLRFMQHTWQKREPFIVGRHTEAVCYEIDKAIERYESGESVFLIITIPFRHGKSEIISKYLPAHFLGLFPEDEILLTTYGQDLANDFSRFARDLLRAPEYQELFPGIELRSDAEAVHHWQISNASGGLNAAGLGGTLTGRGYHLGIVDDYHKKREEAESQARRDRNWDSFKDDFMTRRAPISITIILATPWHVDDIIGRIERDMKTTPDFPRFNRITIPAFSDAYPEGILFPERFPAAWYRTQKATLGTYGTASLLQCNPTKRTGDILKTDKIDIVIDPAAIPPGLRLGRAWDLASSVKELTKQDPDFTVGLKGGIAWEKPEDETVAAHEWIPHLWITHIIRGQWEAPERDRIIKQTALIDGAAVPVGTESVGGFKDTYTRVKAVLARIRTVEKITPPADLLIRVNPLEPIFEAGNVHLIYDPKWNQEFIDECSDFPSGAHDDIIAALVTLWEMLFSLRVKIGKQETKKKPITAGMRTREF